MMSTTLIRPPGRRRQALGPYYLAVRGAAWRGPTMGLAPAQQLSVLSVISYIYRSPIERGIPGLALSRRRCRRARPCTSRPSGGTASSRCAAHQNVDLITRTAHYASFNMSGTGCNEHTGGTASSPRGCVRRPRLRHTRLSPRIAARPFHTRLPIIFSRCVSKATIGFIPSPASPECSRSRAVSLPARLG
jgi:hypothetical protein